MIEGNIEALCIESLNLQKEALAMCKDKVFLLF